MVTTATVAESWRAHVDRTPDWCDQYWLSYDMPHRHLILTILRDLQPWRTILELGCGAGGMLRAIKDAFQDAELCGLDISDKAIGYARNRSGFRWNVAAGPYSVIGAMPTGSVDVVLSCYALAYCAPEDLRLVLMEAVRVAKVGLVIAEPMLGPPGRCNPDNRTVEWRHDYMRALLSLDNDPSRLIIREIPPVDRLDAILVAKK